MSAVLNYTLPPAPEPRGPVAVPCEVTPGKVQTVEVPAESLERFVSVRMAPVPGKPGIYRAQVKAHAPLVPVTDDLGARMGWGLERRQVLALIAAGLVDGYRATTATTLVDPESVWAHIYNTRLSTGDAGQCLAQEFWTAERVRHYSDAAEFVRAAGIVSQARRGQAAEVPHLEFDFGDADSQSADKAA